MTSEKKTVLLCLEDNAITKRLTLKSRDAKVHVLSMSKLTYNVSEISGQLNVLLLKAINLYKQFFSGVCDCKLH